MVQGKHLHSIKSRTEKSQEVLAQSKNKAQQGKYQLLQLLVQHLWHMINSHGFQTWGADSSSSASYNSLFLNLAPLHPCSFCQWRAVVTILSF